MSFPIDPTLVEPAQLGRYELYVAAAVIAMGTEGIALGRPDLAKRACDLAESLINEQDSRAPGPGYRDLMTNLH